MTSPDTSARALGGVARVATGGDGSSACGAGAGLASLGVESAGGALSGADVDGVVDSTLDSTLVSCAEALVKVENSENPAMSWTISTTRNTARDISSAIRIIRIIGDRKSVV